MNKLTPETQRPCQGLASEQGSSISQPTGNSGTHFVTMATDSQSQSLAVDTSAMVANGTPAPVTISLASRCAESLPESMPDNDNPTTAKDTAKVPDKNLRIYSEVNLSNCATSDAIVTEPVEVRPPPLSIPDRNPQMIRESENLENMAEQRLVPARDWEILHSALLRICGLPDNPDRAVTDHSLLAYFIGWLSSAPKQPPPEWFIMEAVYAFFTLTPPDPVHPRHREQQLLQQFMRSSVSTWLHRMAAGKNMVAVEAGLRRAGVDINHKYGKSDYCDTICCFTVSETPPCCSILGDTPLIVAYRNKHWNMLGTLLEAKDSDITQLTYGKKHLLCRLFTLRENSLIDDNSLMSLTKISLKKHARKTVNSETPGWGRQVPLALYAFIHAALNGVNTRLMTTILANYPWVRPLLKENQIATNLVFDVAQGEKELPHTLDYLLNLPDENGQPLIELKRSRERLGSKSYRINITQPGKDTQSGRVVSHAVGNFGGLVIPAGIKKR
ncbi:hypothetical protein [Endozoicomonas sp. ONNA2]|uniref:hypothetical protein n=1 Tax=Endozoicomonas sp. ONNA2 TaxID=2828741 RepID=UPI00214756D1|nr:hypothetical protein [Endozoicomonas sp. ONNA2]